MMKLSSLAASIFPWSCERRMAFVCTCPCGKSDLLQEKVGILHLHSWIKSPICVSPVEFVCSLKCTCRVASHFACSVACKCSASIFKHYNFRQQASQELPSSGKDRPLGVGDHFMITMFFLVGALFLSLGVAATPASPADLLNYVNTPDPAFAWADTNNTFHDQLFSAYYLNLTSQTWLTPQDFVGPNGYLWQHQLVCIVPAIVLHRDVAGIYATAGHQGDSPPAVTSEDVLVQLNSS